MKIVLYSFPKKHENSIERPDITHEPFELDGELATSFDVENPVVMFAIDPKVKPGFNYAYIKDLDKHYYWISGWTRTPGFWIATMIEDYGATFADEIFQSSQYVLRSTNKNNGHLVDSVYPTFAAPDVKRSEGYTFPSFSASFDSGSYVLGFISPSDNGIGASTYYVFTPADFRAFIHNMLSTTNWIDGDTIPDVSPGLLKTLFNPMQYISSAMWFPLDVAKPGRTTGTIPLGWNWGISATYRRPNGSTVQDYMTIPISKHPQGSARGRYLYSAPYSQYTAFIPTIGQVELDAGVLADYNSVTFRIDVDTITGQGHLIGYAGTKTSGPIILDLYLQVSVPVGLAQSNLAPLGNLKSVRGGAVAGAVGFEEGIWDIGNRIKNVASGAIGANTSITTTGANGSLLITDPFRIQSRFWLQTKEDLSRFGKPLCETVTISTLSGYAICQDAAIASNRMTLTEKRAVEKMLNDGFYIEGED